MGMLNIMPCAGRLRRVLALCATALFCVAEVSLAQPANEIDIRIDKVQGVLPGDTIEVGIDILNASSHLLGGAALEMQYESKGLEFIDGYGVSGPCPWFSEHVEEYAPGKLHFVGVIAEPGCSIDDLGNPVVVLQFRVKEDSIVPGHILPVQFYWTECTRNELSDDLGLNTFYSEEVYRWFDEVNPVNHDSDLPTIFGIPDSCDQATSPDRIINLYNGFVQVGQDSLLFDVGDINLNGIPFEIGDGVLLQSYLIMGSGAFNVDPDLQLWTSDTNADLLPAKLSDYIYLLKVISGQAVPTQGWRGFESKDTATVTHDLGAKTVSISWPDSLVAMLLRFKGAVELVSTDLPYQLDTATVGSEIVMYYWPSFGSGDFPKFDGDVTVNYTGFGRLSEVQLADVEDRRIPISVARFTENGLPCGDVDGNGAVSITDAVDLISYVFSGGQPPPFLSTADVNCDAQFTVADAVLIVNYIFGGGPSPCSLCP